MITAAGLLLFQLAKQDLKPELAEKTTLSFFCANAIVAPTLGNFTDLCQLPLLIFTLLLGLRTKKAGLVIISTFLIPLVREDTGIVLASIGIWISVQNPQKRALGIALIVIGMTWVGVVTNIFMPAFGDDNAKRFMVSNFGQFAPDKERATSIDITRQVLSQPTIFARELASPPKDTLMYILGMGLPLLFVPLVAKDALLVPTTDRNPARTREQRSAVNQHSLHLPCGARTLRGEHLLVEISTIPLSFQAPKKHLEWMHCTFPDFCNRRGPESQFLIRNSR